MYDLYLGHQTVPHSERLHHARYRFGKIVCLLCLKVRQLNPIRGLQGFLLKRLPLIC